MAPITWTDVVEFMPRASTIEVGAQGTILDYVNSIATNDCLDGEDGPKTRLYRIYRACHSATMIIRGAGDTVGPVASHSLGPQSRSYGAVISALSSNLESTNFGKLAKSLVMNSPCRLPFNV